MFQRAVDRLARTKAIRGRSEVRLEDRLQDALDRRLYGSVLDGRNAQRSMFPWLSRLGNQDAPCWAGTIFAGAQIFPKLGEERSPSSRVDDIPNRLPVYACGATTAICGDAREGDPQVVRVCNEPPQLGKYVVGLLLTLLKQLPLHVLEPALIERRCHIHGFPQRRRVRFHLLSPFAMYAAFPRADYYGDSVPRSRHRRTWRLAESRDSALGSRFPCFQDGPVVR